MCSVHPQRTVSKVLGLFAAGSTPREIACLTNLPESTVGHWCRGDRRRPGAPRVPCSRCTGETVNERRYAYLLGSYLGDGHITVGRRGVQALSLYCSEAWPEIMNEVAAAMWAVLPSSVCRVRRPGCSELKSYSKHWTCLFPQHGPGRKHTRAIVLEPWQEQIVERHTWRFLRGLFHSDGCRMTNWTQRQVGDEMKRYEYPRYCALKQRSVWVRIPTGALT